MNLIFLGPPGAGKGTQAVGVSARLNVPHISTGDMLRSAVKNETPVGLQATKYMEAGQLVPDQILVEMVKERLSMDDCLNGYLLDGFPRTVEQAVALDKIQAPDAVVNVEVPDEKLMDRLTGRRVCESCHGTFHISRLENENVCPVCDDKPDTIRERLRVYHESTAPLIGYYANNGKLKTVDGDKRPEDVLKAILASLE